MARKHEAADLLLQGNPPSRVAEKMGISFASVKQYLCNQVGEGRIFRYQILHSIDRNARDVFESTIEKSTPRSSLDDFLALLGKELRAAGVPFDANDLLTYLEFRDAALADMYELIRKVETHLHRSIKKALKAKFGENSWWREGIPENIRVECAGLLEKDQEPAKDPYCYTTVMHLKDIYDKRWAILVSTLPDRVQADKQAFLADLTRLNRIRNSVMHPVRGIRLRDDDFSFVQEFKTSLEIKV